MISFRITEGMAALQELEARDKAAEPDLAIIFCLKEWSLFVPNMQRKNNQHHLKLYFKKETKFPNPHKLPPLP